MNPFDPFSRNGKPRPDNAFEETDKTVSADKFLLKDEAGNVRAALTLEGEAPRFAMFDKSGTPRLSLGIDHAMLLDASGKGRIGLAFNQCDEGPSFHVVGADGNPVCQIISGKQQVGEHGVKHYTKVMLFGGEESMIEACVFEDMNLQFLKIIELGGDTIATLPPGPDGDEFDDDSDEE